MYKYKCGKIKVTFDPDKWNFTLTIKNEDWSLVKKPYLLLEGDRKLTFEDAKCNERLHPGIFINDCERIELKKICIHNTGGLEVIAKINGWSIPSVTQDFISMKENKLYRLKH